MGLTRQDLARAGLKLLNEVGLNGLTLRLIGEELGVKASALYWHMKNKQELLDEMATQMYRDYTADRPSRMENGDWEEFLRSRSYVLRQMMLDYRDGAKVFSGTFFTEEQLPNAAPVRQFADAGFDPDRAERALFTLYSYVVGFTIEEQAMYPMPGERDERYPAMDTDARFEDGLAILLAGIGVFLSDGAR